MLLAAFCLLTERKYSNQRLKRDTRSARLPTLFAPAVGAEDTELMHRGITMKLRALTTHCDYTFGPTVITQHSPVAQESGGSHVLRESHFSR